jgi:hypothetical protein
MESLMDRGRGGQYERMIVQYPYAGRQQVCTACGLRIPYGFQTCPYCLAPQTTPQTTQQSNAPVPTIDVTDQQVLDYIAAHDGTISMSQAARDLGLSSGALRITIEKLKSSGLLRPT